MIGWIAAALVAGTCAPAARATGLAPRDAPHPEAAEVPPPDVADAPPPVDQRPFLLSDAMRAWVHKRVFEVGTADERMHRLLAAIEQDLPLVYDAQHTGTAEEVFDSGRYNCLALAHLIVGLGREIGVDAYYVRIEEYRSYHQRGDLVLASTHVAAGWGPPAHVRLIEPTGQDPTERDSRAAIPIDDDAATALHDANRGAELLVAGRPEAALRWLEQALAVDPETPEAWVNLGVAHRRLGANALAESAYRKALALRPQDLSAWRNLASLVQSGGDLLAARDLLAILDRPGYRNPFTYLTLGDLSAQTGHLADAGRFYRRATALDHGHPQIRAARGEWALATGDREDAARWLVRARRADPEDPRVRALAARLASAGT